MTRKRCQKLQSVEFVSSSVLSGISHDVILYRELLKGYGSALDLSRRSLGGGGCNERRTARSLYRGNGRLAIRLRQAFGGHVRLRQAYGGTRTPKPVCPERVSDRLLKITKTG